MSSLPSDNLLELARHVLEANQLTRYALLSSALIIFYDYVISFEREVELIWGKRWSIIKAVFLWYRYFGILCAIFELAAFMNNNVTDSFCYFWIRWETWGYFAIVLMTEVVLLLWIFVIHNRNLWVLGFMGFLLFTEIAIVATILAKSFSNFHDVAHLIPGITFCLTIREPFFFHTVWSPVLAYHTILFGLYLAKGFMVYRQRGSRTWTSTGLLETIYKNSFIDFLAIFAAYLSCAVMWLAADPFLAQIPVGFAVTFSITGCTRLLLNIRDAYYAQSQDDPYNVSTRQAGIVVTGTSSGYWIEDESESSSVRAPSIYAEYTPRDLWAFELREMKWSGNLED